MASLPGLLLLTACVTPGLLADVPIVGGSEEVQEAIRNELVAFDEATGFGRAKVSKVRVKDMDRTGTYDRFTHAINLLEDRETDDLITTLRHELCHALDQQEDLSKEKAELLDERAKELFGSGAVSDASCKTRTCQRREVFAMYCALGPSAAHTFREACPRDPEDGQALLRQMAEEVWTSASAPLLPGLLQPAWASFELPAGEEQLSAAATVGQDAFLLDWGAAQGFFEARTGERVGEQELLGEPGGEPQGLPDELWLGGGSGWVTGPWLGVVSVDLYDQGFVRRTAWHDGERWSLVADGCMEGREAFIAKDRVLTLRRDGARVLWGPLVP